MIKGAGSLNSLASALASAKASAAALLRADRA
jgi:hypothetical protein